MNRFFSHGKLLLSSEYVVLDGALALAVPTQLGQELFVSENTQEQGKIYWETCYEDQLWLSAEIDYQNWEIISCNQPESANFILKTLQAVQYLSQKRLRHGGVSYHLKTNVQFPANFGLGSSSTLLANLATWAEIDAFQLNEICLGGSGYDIAVAQKGESILYQLHPFRKVEAVDFRPDFRNELVFVHLNQKQDSREGIKLYRSREKSASLISQFTEITKKICSCTDIDTFSELMNHHEHLLSEFLDLKTIKEQQFSDCPAFIKSLGAWGGDFVMTRKFPYYENYFKNKNFSRIFTWDEMISEK